MKVEDVERSAKLFSLIFGRPPTEQEWDNLVGGAESYQIFRAKLIAYGSIGDAANATLDVWRKVMNGNAGMDSVFQAELMFSLENMIEKERLLQKRLNDISATMMAKMQEFDKIVGMVAETQKDVLEIRKLLSIYYKKLSEN